MVVAILGTETRSGDFEVADALFAGVPDKSTKVEGVTTDEHKMEVDQEDQQGWVAIIGGLELEPSAATVTANKSSKVENGVEDHGMMGYAEKEMRLMLLTDWLMGHSADAQVSHHFLPHLQASILNP